MRPRMGGVGALFLLLWTAGLCLPSAMLAQDALRLHFLDVGQGDAVLIQSPDGRSVLYDGGHRSGGALEKLRALGVEELELVVASHNHADHVGGLIEVVAALRPRFFMDNAIPHTTRTYEDLLVAVREADSALLAPSERTIRLDSVLLRVLPPPGDPELGQNDNSVGLLVEYGEFRAFLGGDAEARLWTWWLARHRPLLEHVQVHKASHHGSRNGDTQEALRALGPEIVVIGVGADNPYSHPHPSALALYREVGARVLRTDLDGTVRVEGFADGSMRIATARSEGTGDVSPGCIDINRAPPAALLEIRHIGEERAAQIVRLRGVRPFRSLDELTRVDGIGAARLGDILAQGAACAG